MLCYWNDHDIIIHMIGSLIISLLIIGSVSWDMSREDQKPIVKTEINREEIKDTLNDDLQKNIDNNDSLLRNEE